MTKADAKENHSTSSTASTSSPQASSGHKPRPPIVVVMGHVDHGKTKLLDYIRKTNVAAKEAGGITQAVGAYEIVHVAHEPRTDAERTQTSAESIPRQSASSPRSSAESDFAAEGRKITFIDTPGHEAFSAMRSRGAKIADLAVLVVAADEGVKPQTKEAINILKKTETPFVVAVNKIDKTNGDMERAKNDLMGAEVFLEGFGGQTSYHGVSAKTGEGMNELLDLIILVADVEGLTYDPGAPASGYVLEARQDKRRGVEATLILRDGTIRRGEEVFTPTTQGKAKILENFLGKTVEALEPSSPAVVVGWEFLPHAGEPFSVGSRPKAEEGAKSGEKIVYESGKYTLNLLLKASDSGSLEVLSTIIAALGTKENPLRIVSESVGDITDGDVKTAVATGAFIIGFKNKADKAAKNLAEGQDVRIITSEIVYELVKAVEEFLKEIGKPKALGELEVLAVFNQKKLSEQLVGGRIVSGIFKNKGAFTVLRRLASAQGSSPLRQPASPKLSLRPRSEASQRGESSSEASEAMGEMGSGKILNAREKKADIIQAETGKEIGILADSKVKIEVGDRLTVYK